jgi:tRNA A-37 threonylcarbamoyl transferase component Bud32
MELETAPAVGASPSAGSHRTRAGLIDLRCGRTRWQVRPELASDLLDSVAIDVGRALLPVFRGSAENRRAAVPTLRESAGLSLEDWLADGAAEIVKSGPHRAVYRLALPAGDFYLKHYRIPGPRAALQNVIRPCKAMLEFRAAQRVAACGIPTAEAVAVGRTFSGWRVTDNYLITKAIPDVVPLHDYLLSDFPELPAAEQTRIRQQIARRLGRLAGRMHRGRLAHHDFHAGNVLIRIDEDRVRLWLIDLHALSHRLWLIEREARENLASLGHFFTALATPSDRLRFFTSYWRERRGESFNHAASAFASAVRRVEDFCRRATIEAFRRDDKKWRRANRRVRTIHGDGIRIRGLAELGDDFLQSVVERPDLLFDASRVQTWNHRSADCRDALILLPVNGETRMCRAIWTAAPVGRLVFRRRNPAARLAWEAGHALLRRRIPAVRPLLHADFAPPTCAGSLLLI